MNPLKLAQKTLSCERYMLAGLSIYICSYFLPFNKGLANFGMHLAFLAWLVYFIKEHDYKRLAAPLFVLVLILSSYFYVQAWALNLPVFKSIRTDFDNFLLLFFPVSHLAAHSRTRSKLLLYFSIGAVILAVTLMSITAYQRWLLLDENPILLRRWGEAINVFVFFALGGLAFVKNSIGRALLWVSSIFLLIAALDTGARSVWLAVGLGLAALFFIFPKTKSLKWYLLLFALSVTTLIVSPQSYFKQRLEQGFDTSLRTTGTWGPTLAMVQERPIFGHGYGMQLYHDEYKKRLPQHPEWPYKESMGPHNIFLKVLFSGGVVGLSIFLCMFIVAMNHVLKVYRARSGVSNDIVYAAIACFTLYFIRGNFEDVSLETLSLLLPYIYGCYLATLRDEQNATV